MALVATYFMFIDHNYELTIQHEMLFSFFYILFNLMLIFTFTFENFCTLFIYINDLIPRGLYVLRGMNNKNL